MDSPQLYLGNICEKIFSDSPEFLTLDFFLVKCSGELTHAHDDEWTQRHCWLKSFAFFIFMKVL